MEQYNGYSNKDTWLSALNINQSKNAVLHFDRSENGNVLSPEDFKNQVISYLKSPNVKDTINTENIDFENLYQHFQEP